MTQPTDEPQDTGLGASDTPPSLPEPVPFPIDPDLTPADPGEPSPTHRAGRPVASRLRPATLASVWVGGALGTLARYAASRAWTSPAGTFPLAIFVINTSGAFALGLLLTVLIEHRPRRAWIWRPLLATGVLGGWTTFSTLVVGTDSLIRADAPGMAIGYIAGTLVAGILAAGTGMALGRRWRSATDRVPA